MKTLTLELKKDIFTDFTLTSEDMINVRGGGEPEPLPSYPPIKI
jgi:hypothetical protein